MREISHVHKGNQGKAFMAMSVTCENEKSVTASLYCLRYMLIKTAVLNLPAVLSVYLLCTAPGYECSGTLPWSIDVAPQSLPPPSVLTLWLHQSRKQLIIPTSAHESLNITLFKVLMIMHALQTFSALKLCKCLFRILQNQEPLPVNANKI